MQVCYLVMQCVLLGDAGVLLGNAGVLLGDAGVLQAEPPVSLLP